MKCFTSGVLALRLLASASAIASGQTNPSPDATAAAPEQQLAAHLRARIDESVEGILAKTGAPSASVAVVKDGQLVYAHAYGMANVAEHLPTTPANRYSIGSISKQFTAAAILFLAQDGKLSLEDPVSKWLPQLTRANDVTVREILSMTSGYQDFWPQDYVMPTMMKSVTPQQILDNWGRKPLDFEPGTRWQYSNTNYVIAGLIVERITGTPLLRFLEQRIFRPLGMKSIFNSDADPLPKGEPMRYLRYGLGPIRPAPKEGKGWMFAAGELAMTASDLAHWDISMINETVLKRESYDQMEKAVLLKNGASAQYGLGVGVTLVNGRRRIAHSGEVSGFTAQNSVYPDDRAAVVVLTNIDATSASADIANSIAEMLFGPQSGAGPVGEAKAILADLQKGKINRAKFTSNANDYFSEQALHDLAHSLGPLGSPVEFAETSEGLRGGMIFHRYRAVFRTANLVITTYTMPDGKLEQYIVESEG